MSQQKVNRNKNLKHNRKQLVKKRKRNETIAVICSSVVALIFVIWVGYSAIGTFGFDSDVSYTYYNIDITAIDDYLDSITAEEDTEEEVEEEDTEEEATDADEDSEEADEDTEDATDSEDSEADEETEES